MIEKSIHDEIVKLLQRISDEHHIEVERISVDWLDVSGHGARKHIIRVVDMDTTQKWPR